MKDDAGGVAAAVYLVIALTLIFVALALITKHMRQLVAGGMEAAMNRLIGAGGGAIGILVGIGVTVAVQSSSITTFVTSALETSFDASARPSSATPISCKPFIR